MKPVTCHECGGKGWGDYWMDDPADSPIQNCVNCGGTGEEPKHWPEDNGRHKYPHGFMRSFPVDSLIQLSISRKHLMREKRLHPNLTGEIKARRSYADDKRRAFALKYKWASYTFNEGVTISRAKTPAKSFVAEAIAESFNRMFGVAA